MDEQDLARIEEILRIYGPLPHDDLISALISEVRRLRKENQSLSEDVEALAYQVESR